MPAIRDKWAVVQLKEDFKKHPIVDFASYNEAHLRFPPTYVNSIIKQIL